MLTKDRFKGTFTALCTPFTQDGGAIDFTSFEKLIDYQLGAGVDGLVVCGSTGEAATLSEDEYLSAVKFVRSKTKGRSFCVAGVGSSDTKRCCSLASAATELGADGILVTTPPYNKPQQRGVVEHFRALSKVTTLPLIAYNIPGRSALNLLPQTIATLADEGLIIGVKESSGNMDQVLDTLALVRDKISVVSGEDSLVNALMASGGHGVISASANVAPELFVKLTRAALSGEWSTARDAQFDLLPIVRAMFIETNPIPAKVGLHLKGVIAHPTVRLPLVAAEKTTVERVKSVLKV